jgi:excisionase family DNA binding protein
VTPARTTSASATTVPRLALSKTEAADALGVSIDFLEQHILHELRIVRRGRRRLIPLTELQRWIDNNAHRTLGDL